MTMVLDDHSVTVVTVRHSKMTDAGEYACRSSDNDVASVVVHVFTGQYPHSNKTRMAEIAASLCAEVRKHDFTILVINSGHPSSTFMSY